MNTSFKKPIALISALLLALFVAAPVLAVAPAPGAFERTWARTDKPVADDVIDRTWIWGPEANTPVLEEPYLDSPGDTREVQYFDKSRMEINNPNAVDDGLWYVTNGLLVVELMTGMMQVGDDDFEERSPAEINIVGDPGYDETPTYADYADLRDNAAFAEGSVITATVDGDGNIGDDNDLAQWNVTADELAPLTGHRTASVFWDFMNSSGIVYEDGDFTTDDLFINPYYATGYPITEAYWSQVMLLGSEQWVLTQAFERRVLTYAPNNNEGFQVEAGNVGLHYYQWRYETEETGTININTFENDGTTAQGDVFVEAHLLEDGEDCDDVTFGTDDPTASGTTNATTGALSLADLDAGTYCVSADFDGDDVADDATAVAVVTAGGTVNVALSNPDDGVASTLTVTVRGDDDLFIAGATVELFAGACAELDAGDTALQTGVTTGSGVAVLDVDDLDDGDYCLLVSDSDGVIDQVDISLPDDTDINIGGMQGVSVTSTVGANEVQTLSATGAISGDFTLTFDGQETDPIPYNASAAIIEDELEELANIAPGDVAVSGGPINQEMVTIEFTGDLGFTNVPELVADSTNLDGGTLSIETTTEAVEGVNEIQTLSSNDASGGTFRLTVGIESTAAIDYDATAAEIEAALGALQLIGPNNIDVSGGPIDSASVTVEFIEDLADTNVDPLGVDNDGLTGGLQGVSVLTTTQGVDAVNEVQTLAATNATSGTFTLTFNGQTTDPMPYNASAAVIEDELEELANIGPGDVLVTGGPANVADVLIEFTGTFAEADVSLLTGDNSGLVGTEIMVATTTQGAPPVVQMVHVGSAVTGGTFTLTYEGATTGPIDYDATAAEIDAALEALATITSVTVTGDLGPGGTATITFVAPSPPASLLVVDDSLTT